MIPEVASLTCKKRSEKGFPAFKLTLAGGAEDSGTTSILLFSSLERVLGTGVRLRPA
jgi:hypothetical protein